MAEPLAGTLNGHPRDHRSLMTAPARVRSARSELQGLADRYQAVRQARHLAGLAAVQQIERDAEGQFVRFADPHTLAGVEPGKTPLSRIDYPTDPIELMLWLFGPAKPGRPWLPTAEEQAPAGGAPSTSTPCSSARANVAFAQAVAVAHRPRPARRFGPETDH